MKQLKNIALVIGVAGTWLIVVLGALLALVQADHYDLMAWSFLALILSLVVNLGGFALVLSEIKGCKND